MALIRSSAFATPRAKAMADRGPGRPSPKCPTATYPCNEKAQHRNEEANLPHTWRAAPTLVHSSRLTFEARAANSSKPDKSV